MKRLLPALLALLLAAAVPAADQTYRIVHPDGTVEFTDEPAPGAESFEVPEVQTYEPRVPDLPATRSNRGAQPAAGSPAQPSVAVTSPAPQGTVRSAAGTMSVSVAVEPALREEQRVVLFLDGNQVAAGRQSVFQLENVWRGEHTVQAQVRDAGGRVVSSSEPVTFFMHQPSALTPRPNP